MSVVAGIAVLTHILVSAAMGIRLLWVARRTRGVPELTIGAAFTSMTLVGYPLVVASGFGRVDVAEASVSAFAIGTAFIDLGAFFIFVFTWRVFRPGRAAALAFVIGAGIAACLHAAGAGHAAFTADPGSPSAEVIRRSSNLMTALLGAGFGWSGIESYRYYRLMLRRVAIGLAEPLVCNRFLLWSLSGLAATLMIAGSILLGSLGRTPLNDPTAGVWISACGLVASSCLYLAILPPLRYARWVQRGARGFDAYR